MTEVKPKEKLQSKDASVPNCDWDEKLSFSVFNKRMSVRVDVYEWDLLGDHNMIASAVLSLPEALERSEVNAAPGVARNAEGHRYPLWQRTASTDTIPKPRGTLRFSMGWDPVDDRSVTLR